LKFEKLEILELDFNKISDISVLEKVNLRNLKLLDLRYNLFSDIGKLESKIRKDIIRLK